ncbi:GNAT family N-acetyltransferase [Agrococcus beijingensis]|uniref:GNAT family N-acetyltransferase n=1 Tax=Agrococcus beijingensis TaxID=3068634 RepID=UPI0027416DA4|nr:GNAT family N-acetyltransferase [Agrococcus sp. REN33]
MGDGARYRGAILIRSATRADAEALLPLLAAHRSVDEEDEKVDRYRERLVALVENPAHHIVVAELDGRVIGYAAAQDYGPAPQRDWSIARMHDLWVSPDARGHGAGTALFEAVREWAEEHTRVRVLEWQSLEVAKEFYAKLGLSGERVDEADPRELYEIEVHLPSRG